MDKHHKVIVVLGPTASGKSDFAVELAKKYNGEIISADSRQIYKGLDIGTGKITEEEMKGVPHYMLDICELSDDFSVAEYKRLATPVLEDILTRDKTPIICGGTGQYIDALIYAQEIPPVAPNKELRVELEKKTTDELYNELVSKDARRAEDIDKHNKVRIIRALEIIDAIGIVPSQSNTHFIRPTEIYCMDISRDLLRERITKRLYKRLDTGMVDEVKKIMKEGYVSDAMRKFGLEYVSIAKYLEGKTTEEEMKEEIITKSMQYAKRQQTWNKKYLTSAKKIEVKE
jgi:tRNA dimethylallyltransferase